MTGTRFIWISLTTSVAALFITACTSETIEVSFDTYALAIESGALQKGWLPLWLPSEANRIFERHNLDTNARMWAAEVPVGTTVSLPSACTSIKAENLPKAPFDRHWWPEGVPHGRQSGQEFFYFNCDETFVGLAAAGGKLVGWAVQ